jgi:hypothetical protein
VTDPDCGWPSLPVGLVTRWWCTQTELAELFGVGRSTIYRTIERVRPRPVEAERPFAYLEAPTVTQSRNQRPTETAG